jgi:HSP20 family molecular chaperone IbpA
VLRELRKEETQNVKSDSPTAVSIVPQVQLESSLLHKIAEIRHKIAHRAHESFASRGFTHGHDLADWFHAESELFREMPIKVTETDQAVTVKAGVPGFIEKHLEISVEPRWLVIAGTHEKKSENKEKDRTIYSETSNQVFRAFHLAAEIDPCKARAFLNNGELEITLPKREISTQLAAKKAAS